jgi:hypothetical protein
VRTSRGSLVADDVNTVRLDSIFQPRLLNGNVVSVNTQYEPIVKVRPLSMANLRTDSTGYLRYPIVDFGEQLVFGFVTLPSTLGLRFPNAAVFNSTPLLEVEIQPVGPLTSLSTADAPPISGALRVYPAVQPVRPFTVESFLRDDPEYGRYRSRFLSGKKTSCDPAELKKLLDSRIGWTAFYRRLSYDIAREPGPDNTLGNADDVFVQRGEPGLYEIIVVVTARVSQSHRYAVQDTAIGGENRLRKPKAAKGSSVAATSPYGADRLFPAPWLVTFAQMPVLSRGLGQYAAIDGGACGRRRFLAAGDVAVSVRGRSLAAAARGQHHHPRGE